MTPEQARQIADPLKKATWASHRDRGSPRAVEEGGRYWSAVRAEAVQELKQGRTSAQVAELLGVSEATAWNIAHAKRG